MTFDTFAFSVNAKALLVLSKGDTPCKLTQLADYGILFSEMYHLKEKSYGNSYRFDQRMGSDT